MTLFCKTTNTKKWGWVAGTALLFCIIVTSGYHPCQAAVSPSDLPAVLQPWVNWVLHDKLKQVSCTPHYDDANRLECSWPGTLNISLDDKGGKFDQEWEICHDTWVPLPGGTGQWPLNVRVNNTPGLLMLHNGGPAIHLVPGQYGITGDFQWNTLPEHLKLPERTGLFSLQIKGEAVPFPQMDSQGRLWLKTTQKNQKEADGLKVERFRKIVDDIPPRVILHTTLEVAGKAREITLGPLYDSALFIPLSLESALPARLSQEGTLRIQVRPGRYEFSLVLRYVNPLAQLTLNGAEPHYQPDHEIWSVERRPGLRIVEISGIPSVDPRLTSLPREWQRFPAYRMKPGETMTFKEIKRGDPVPAPDRLTLDRTLWLRFDGSGYTVQDRITGQKNSDWRLEMDADMVPGKVTVDGVEQLITKRAVTDKPGVEIRKGMLHLTSENRFDKGIYHIPATGWDHDFNQVTGRLQLPPGWKLIHARGMDNIPGTWLKKWTLLDFFMVVIFTIATAKLFSIPLSLVGFVTLVLIFHEPLAPRYVWPALLVGIALLRYLPPGKFRKIIRVLHGTVVLILVFTAIPYVIHTLRVGIYPQLEKPWISMNTDDGTVQSAVQGYGGSDQLQETMVNQEAEPYRLKTFDKARKLAAPLPARSTSMISTPRPMKPMADPDAMTQTGPGLPRWQPFTTIPFSWSGPVEPGETVTFTLMGPGANRFLAFLRVGLIALLAAGLLGGGWKRKTGFSWSKASAGEGVMMAGLFLICIVGSATPCPATEIPSPEMLQTLQERLLEQKECFPACADITDATIDINAHELIIILKINAHLDTMIPLPGHARHWLPSNALLDGSDVPTVIRENEVLWMRVPEGSHDIVLQGRVPNINTLQLPFVLKPHFTRITALQWTVQGHNPDGTLDGTLHFTRISTGKEPQEEILTTGVLPAFARVERHIVLGKEWQVETTVHRVTPLGSAVALQIPLLSGESVTTRNVTVKQGRVQVNMDAGEMQFQWRSFLEPMDTLVLFHEKTREWTEVWTLDVAPRFHVETEGIPVILHQVDQRWMPTWHPWPGEKVTLNISRPPAIKGNTLTLEKSHLVLRPGRRTTQAQLSLEMKSTQGGQHTIQLPDNARLEEMTIDGKVQLIRQEGRFVPLPLSPGTSRVSLKWREARGMGMFYPTSDIDLNHVSVNAGMDVYLPADRWPLFVGGAPLTGPAVLFWSVLFVVILISAGVAMSGLTPLRFHHLFLLGLGMSMSSLGACFFVGLWLVAMNRRKKIMTEITDETGMDTPAGADAASTVTADAEKIKGTVATTTATTVDAADAATTATTVIADSTAAAETAVAAAAEIVSSKKHFNMIQVALAALTLVAAGSLLSAVAQGLLGHPDMNITGNGSSAHLLRWYQDVSDNKLPVAWVISIPMLCYRLAMLAWALWISFGLIYMVKWAWQAYTTPVIWYPLPRKPFRLRKAKQPEENKKPVS